MAIGEWRDQDDGLPIEAARTPERIDYLDDMANSVLAGVSARGLILRDLRDLRIVLETYGNLKEQELRQRGIAELDALQAQIMGEEQGHTATES